MLPDAVKNMLPSDLAVKINDAFGAQPTMQANLQQGPSNTRSRSHGMAYGDPQGFDDRASSRKGCGKSNTKGPMKETLSEEHVQRFDEMSGGKGKGKGRPCYDSFATDYAQNGSCWMDGPLSEDQLQRLDDGYGRSKGKGKGQASCESFATNFAQNGSMAIGRSRALSFQTDIGRNDSFAVGLQPCQTRPPVGFAGNAEGLNTQAPGGFNTRTTSFVGGSSTSHTTGQPHQGCTTRTPQSGSFSQLPTAGSFACMPDSRQHMRNGAAMGMIRE